MTEQRKINSNIEHQSDLQSELGSEPNLGRYRNWNFKLAYHLWKHVSKVLIALLCPCISMNVSNLKRLFPVYLFCFQSGFCVSNLSFLFPIKKYCLSENHRLKRNPYPERPSICIGFLPEVPAISLKKVFAKTVLPVPTGPRMFWILQPDR